MVSGSSQDRNGRIATCTTEKSSHNPSYPGVPPSSSMPKAVMLSFAYARPAQLLEVRWHVGFTKFEADEIMLSTMVETTYGQILNCASFRLGSGISMEMASKISYGSISMGPHGHSSIRLEPTISPASFPVRPPP